MPTEKLKKILDELRALPAETEWVEFKRASLDMHFNDIGKYFSALSNEANLKSRECGWLILGVEDKTRKITGTQYRIHRHDLDSLKNEIANKTTNRISFIEIYELKLPEGRVVMFEIPAAPQGIPIAWEGHYYGREGESLSPLNLQEIEQIRRQIPRDDWSAQVCIGATIDDLLPEAIAKARVEFKKKYPGLSVESSKWDDIAFLNKAKITIHGKITRAAIILLGRTESEHFLSPGVVKISWILKDEHNIEKDYEHFGPPFILNTDAALAKIRNLRYRYLPDNTLFPIEITQYEPYVIREAMHNCVAHQDYELNSRIILVEKPDELIFTNAGSFIPESVEAVIAQDAPQKYYRNQHLTTAMAALNMIDTIGGGIKKMFLLQKERFFPLPTYKIDKHNEVTVKIFGKVIDENYTRVLMKETALDIKHVMLLDKVQKKEKIGKNEARFLKAMKLVEGRYPKLFVASRIAAVTGDKAIYIKNRALDKDYYKQMVVKFIKEYGSASRKDIDDLLIEKLSNALSPQQKIKKIGNMLYEMTKRDKMIKNIGSDRSPKWVLVE